MRGVTETEALEQIAELIRDIGLQYQDGRRYRAIAQLCEEQHLGRALAIGAAVRRALRARGGVGLPWTERAPRGRAHGPRRHGPRIRLSATEAPRPAVDPPPQRSLSAVTTAT